MPQKKNTFPITHNSRARRRLFAADDHNDQAKIDNFANILQESITRDRIEKSLKWNFDFVNEIPLDGTYDWQPCNGTADWIGVKSEKDCDVTEDSFLAKKLENEVTPRIRDEETIPNLKKRRRNAEAVASKAVRRKISFE